MPFNEDGSRTSSVRRYTLPKVELAREREEEKKKQRKRLDEGLKAQKARRALKKKQDQLRSEMRGRARDARAAGTFQRISDRNTPAGETPALRGRPDPRANESSYAKQMREAGEAKRVAADADAGGEGFRQQYVGPSEAEQAARKTTKRPATKEDFGNLAGDFEKWKEKYAAEEAKRVAEKAATKAEGGMGVKKAAAEAVAETAESGGGRRRHNAPWKSERQSGSIRRQAISNNIVRLERKFKRQGMGEDEAKDAAMAQMEIRLGPDDDDLDTIVNNEEGIMYKGFSEYRPGSRGDGEGAPAGGVGEAPISTPEEEVQAEVMEDPQAAAAEQASMQEEQQLQETQEGVAAVNPNTPGEGGAGEVVTGMEQELVGQAPQPFVGPEQGGAGPMGMPEVKPSTQAPKGSPASMAKAKKYGAPPEAEVDFDQWLETTLNSQDTSKWQRAREVQHAVHMDAIMEQLDQIAPIPWLGQGPPPTAHESRGRVGAPR